MGIPTSREIREAILDYLADGKECRRQDIADVLGSQFNLTAAELAEEHPSGGMMPLRSFSSASLPMILLILSPISLSPLRLTISANSPPSGTKISDSGSLEALSETYFMKRSVRM